MGDITTGRTWASGETVTADRLNESLNDAVLNAGSVTTAKLAAGALSADATGLAKMADGFLSADAAGRAKLANGFLPAAKLAGDVGANAWLFKTADYTAVDGDRIAATVTGGAFTVTLPASPAAGNMVTLVDGANDWGATYALTVARNGSTIEGLAENITCDEPGVMIVLFYTGSTWRIYT